MRKMNQITYEQPPKISYSSLILLSSWIIINFSSLDIIEKCSTASFW